MNTENVEIRRKISRDNQKSNQIKQKTLLQNRKTTMAARQADSLSVTY